MSLPQETLLLRLPDDILRRADIARLVHEAENIENDTVTARVRTKVTEVKGRRSPLSDQLADFLDINQIEISTARQRSKLVSDLRKLKDSAPVVHLTFASVADIESIKKVVAWLRTQIHPQVIVNIGLQPDIIGGVYIRTTNRVHDLSIRAKLSESRGVIKKQLEELCGAR